MPLSEPRRAKGPSGIPTGAGGAQQAPPSAESIAALAKEQAAEDIEKLKAVADQKEVGPQDPVKLHDGHDWKQSGPNTFTLRNGIVLSIRPYPEELSRKMQRNLSVNQPTPPREYIESDRKWITHTDDPEYRKAAALYFQRASDIAFFVRASLGTAFKSVPEDFRFPGGPDATDWSDFITSKDIFGDEAVEVAPDGPKRYVDWLQYIALSEGDTADLYEALDEVGGILREEAVQSAMKSFRRLS